MDSEVEIETVTEEEEAGDTLKEGVVGGLVDGEGVKV